MSTEFADFRVRHAKS